ncbi:MAG: hypothetical protein CME32_15170 [Gimesia sp.]|nr:hypothetical protein [Gimesia sp.]
MIITDKHGLTIWINKGFERSTGLLAIQPAETGGAAKILLAEAKRRCDQASIIAQRRSSLVRASFVAGRPLLLTVESFDYC